MTVNTNSSSTDSNFLQQINQKYEDMNSLLNQYLQDAEDLARAELLAVQLLDSDGSDDAIAKQLEIIRSKQADLKSLQSQLMKIDPSLTGADFSAIKGEINSIAGQILRDRDDPITDGQIKEDMETFGAVFKATLKALTDKMEADKCKEIMNHISPDDPHYGQYLAEMIQHLFDAQTCLFNLQDTLFSGTSDASGHKVKGLFDYLNDQNSAIADNDSIHWYDYFSSGTGSEVQRNDTQIANANHMIVWAQQALNALGPVVAALDPDMVGPIAEVKLLVSKAEKIAHSDLPPKEKLHQIMGLLIQVVTILSVTLTAVAKEQAENERMMQKGSQENLEAQQSNQILQMKKLEAALKYADAMKIFMKVAEGIMTAVLLATSGGTLSFALVATMGVLAQTGTMEKAVEALATKMGGSKIGAAALISALSVIAGAGLDGFEKMVSSVATTAVKTTVEGTSQVAIKAAAEAAVKAAGKTGAAATKEAEQIITKAVDVAVEKSLTNTFEKVGKSAFRKLLNAVQKGKSEVAAKELKEALTKAGEMAAKDAIKDAETIAVTVLKADSKMTLTEGLKASETAGQRAGSMAASKVSGMTDKQAEDAFVKSSKMSQKVLRAFSTRTASVGIYGLGSSNLLLEIEKSIAKKDSTEDQVLEALIGVFSAILSALSSAGASGVMKDADIFSGDKMASFLKWMSRLSKLSMAANAGGDLCSADAASRQGDAQANLKKIDGNIELFQLIISRILDSSKTESQKILKQMQVATASNNEFDPYRGDSAAVQVLIAG